MLYWEKRLFFSFLLKSEPVNFILISISPIILEIEEGIN